MNTGKKLEALIKKSAEEQGWDYTRLKDAGWQGEKTQRRFTIENICDCILFDGRILYYVEAKSGKTSITFDRLTQQDDLMKKKHLNVRAGYIVEIKEQWFWLTAEDVEQMQIEINKNSFNDNDAGIYGWELPGVIPKGKRTARINLSYLP